MTELGRFVQQRTGFWYLPSSIGRDDAALADCAAAR
jgi:hypothetical protein